MSNSTRHRWLPAAILAGLSYVVAGVASATLAGAAASGRAEFLWRLSAFVVSAVVLAVHIAIEQVGRRSTARFTAYHASLGAALGGAGLALWANIHDLVSASGYRPRMLIALVAWPVLLAVPTFIVALVVATGLGMKRRRA